MFCAACGAQLEDTATVCKCGKVQPAPLTTAAGGGQTAVATPDTKACPFCGEQVLAAAIRCKHCQSNLTTAAQTAPYPPGVSVQGPNVPAGNQPTIVIQNVQTQQGTQPQGWVPRQFKNPTVALLLSFIFPGGGQFYNGEAGKGILVFLTWWLIIPYIWSLFDAYSSAQRINRTGA